MEYDFSVAVHALQTDKNGRDVQTVLHFYSDMKEDENEVYDFYKAEDTDEGFCAKAVTYYLEEDGDDLYLVQDSYHKERDCDGLMEHWGTAQALIPPAFKRTKSKIIRDLEWKQIEGRQRDHTAESMNY